MDILVYADWIGLEGPALMGTLSVAHTRGREIFSFAYNKAWLDAGLAQTPDPDLQLFTGTEYLSAGIFKLISMFNRSTKPLNAVARKAKSHG